MIITVFFGENTMTFVETESVENLLNFGENKGELTLTERIARFRSFTICCSHHVP